MNIDPRIIEKIKKCLALSASDNPHEAAAGIRQAQKLMAMHGLDQTTVELGPMGEADVRSVASATNLKAWESHLAHTIEDAFGLGLLWRARSSTYGSFVFIGPVGDVQIAKHLFVVLQRQCAKARASKVNDYRYLDHLSGKPLTAKADSYALGWVNGVKDKVDKFVRPESHQQLIKAKVAEICQGRAANHQKGRGLDAQARP